METSAAGGPSARERILDTAYDLFSRHGTHAVGVDAIVAGSGVAKMSLYRNFGSKDELILEFLRRREQLWGRDFLIAEVEAQAEDPAERLLAIFDVLGEWYARDDFEGCSFTKLLFTIDDRAHPVRRAAVQHIDNVRAWLRGLATDAGVEDPDAFSGQWYVLMTGSLVSASAGDAEAARHAADLGRLLLSAELPGRDRLATS
jgi:AcrR family transcriptional regulator